MSNIFDCNVAADAALSNEFAGYLAGKESHGHQTLEFVKRDIEQLIQFSERAIELFDEARDEYNSSVRSYKAQLHLVPNLKKSVKSDITYLSFIWVKLQNKSYRALIGKPHEPGLEPIKPGKNGFYTRKKLNSLLSIKQKAALSLVLETEHVMRFVRLEYEYLMTCRWPISSVRPSKYQQLRVKEALNKQLTEIEEDELREMNVELMFQQNSYDPYKLPVKKAMCKLEKK